MEKARHGGNVSELSRKYGFKISDILDFSASLNDFITESDTIPEVKENLLGTYPGSDEPLRANLAKYNRVPPEYILPGPGLSYFIYRISEIFRNKKALLIRPAFSEYSRAFSTHDVVFSQYPVSHIANLLPEIREEKYSLVCINRPDTPIGDMLDRSSLLELSEACIAGKAFLFIDEAFIDFLPDGERRFSSELVSENKFVILGRSLTKIFSTPSLRAGYLINSGDILNRIRDLMEPWTLGIHIIEAFSNVDFRSVSKYSGLVGEERDFLIKSMHSLGFKVTGNPKANYVTFRTPSNLDVNELSDFLQKNGILIRTLEDFPEFGKDFIRISVKRREKNEVLLSAIKKYMINPGQNIREQ